MILLRIASYPVVRTPGYEAILRNAIKKGGSLGEYPTLNGAQCRHVEDHQTVKCMLYYSWEEAGGRLARLQGKRLEE